jgi:electron transport complex protein RnfE
VLATTSGVSSALGMGLAMLAVIIVSNIVVSLIRKIIPNEIRIPVMIVIIATIVTVVEMLMKAYLPDLAANLGVYLSIIVVNCIIFARAESFALKNGVLDSFLDAIGTGLGFILSVLLLALAREVVGTGAIDFNSFISGESLYLLRIFPQQYAISIFVENSGAFIMLGLLVALISYLVPKIGGMKEKAAKAKAQKMLKPTLETEAK